MNCKLSGLWEILSNLLVLGLYQTYFFRVFTQYVFLCLKKIIHNLMNVAGHQR